MEMLQNTTHSPQEQTTDELSSPVAAHVFDFCDTAEALFPEAIQNYEASSNSSCWFDDTSFAIESVSPFLTFPSDISCFNDPSTLENSNDTIIPNDSLSTFLDAHSDTDLDASVPLDFTSSVSTTDQYQTTFEVPTFLSCENGQFDLATLQISSMDMNQPSGVPSQSLEPVNYDPGLPFGAMLEDISFSTLPVSYPCMDVPPPSSVSFLDQPAMGSYIMGNLNSGISLDGLGLLPGGIMSENRLNLQEFDMQTENYGVYADSIYSPKDLQLLNENQQQMMKGGCGSPVPLASDISTLDESTLRVGRLSVEERKEKIERYLRKRNERNFNKKIKYACRKTLADSRPRVRGRFAKNDELGDATRQSCSNHEEENEDDAFPSSVKEEHDIQGPSDLFAHIDGTNSFKCGYPIQPWI